MDVFSTLDGQVFVWNSEKALQNAYRHGIRFEHAREVFLDALAVYEDASPAHEARIGLTSDFRCSLSSTWSGKVTFFASSLRALQRQRKGSAMKTTDRIRRNTQPHKPMTLISLRLPDAVIDDLKELAPTLGFGGYQALIRAYISNGLRQHLAQLHADRVKTDAVEEFSRRLLAHGIPAQAIHDAAAEMGAAAEG